MSFTSCLVYFQVEEHHAHSIEEIFDAISYKKGSTVIRMLQGYLGDDMFQVEIGSTRLNSSHNVASRMPSSA